MTRSIDTLTGLADPADAQRALVPSGTARAKFGRGRPGVVPRDLAARAAMHDLPPELVYLASDLAHLDQALDDNTRDALLFLVLAVMLAQSEGSTRVHVLGPGGREHLAEVFSTLAGPKVDHGLLIERITRLLEDDEAPTVIGRDVEAYRPLILQGEHVYVQRLLFLERRLAAHFGRHVGVQRALPKVEVQDERLSEEQRAAVERAAVDPLTIISGGPGTGKTSIVVALLRVLLDSGVAPERIAIAAPTGKATNRLRESIEALPNSPTPVTLHRLLGYIPRRDAFRHHENNPIEHEVVIVDESSMIDLQLMERLLRALIPGTRLVLLGDADQLPSVDAGAVLHDFIAARPDHAVRLTKSYRMDAGDPAGAAILRFANGVRDGRIEDDVADGVRTIDARSPAARNRFLERWFERRVRGDDRLAHRLRRPYPFIGGAFRDDDLDDLEAIFAHYTRAKLLCVTRSHTYSTGANATNDTLHRMFAAERGLVEGIGLAVGEPILMLENDYERGLFNGDQGVVLAVGVEGDVVRPTAVFRTASGLEAFPLAQLEHRVERAYAMTVHKAQGSELDHVGLILPEVDVPLLTRQIVYTGVTRARRSVTIAGHPELLRRAVERPMHRSSGLGERLV
ncbi:MAG: exodeoxyribonuclease V subunit alpha [Deltaproteobacteria bacterium]